MSTQALGENSPPVAVCRLQVWILVLSRQPYLLIQLQPALSQLDFFSSILWLKLISCLYSWVSQNAVKSPPPSAGYRANFCLLNITVLHILLIIFILFLARIILYSTFSKTQHNPHFSQSLFLSQNIRSWISILYWHSPCSCQSKVTWLKNLQLIINANANQIPL